MTITELTGGGKRAIDRIPRTWLFIGIVILSSSASFGLGMLEGRQGSDENALTISELATTTPPESVTTMAPKPAVYATSPQPAAAAAAPTTLPAGGQFVASKNGTKYYFPWCGTVKNIKEENKIWFQTREEAEAAGYEPASNCKGL
jgi:hypothetical protein